MSSLRRPSSTRREGERRPARRADVSLREIGAGMSLREIGSAVIAQVSHNRLGQLTKTVARIHTFSTTPHHHEI
jgi:hypothetical protein